MINKLLFLVSFLIVTICSAQNIKRLNGKVVADVKDLQGINIINRTSGIELATSEDGLFSIYAKPGDTLVFTSVQLNEKRIVIEKEDFDYLPFIVKMRQKVIQLKEVVITDSGINAVSLGIVPKGMKTYTPAERRYYTATTGPGILPIDPIINAISGRTKQLKNEIKVERSEMLQQKLSAMFDENYFIEELKIPSAQVDGFFVFASENPELANQVRGKKKPLIELELAKLASEYLKRLSDEK
ncbi:hypothetical protein FEDK69T_14380 [Flavobacterium enshiense DK69]|uniref:TonB-dependent receptor n=1 Tax=Flavobacterium enshiense DK69 TaxID=1107311 RepID=V6S9D9_9FLAO|nr:hypothetical protein [Flavobacterium enshiense]ESU23283.1 hypothetical protein FEDK69T_14380 [Flavobacterium enshiense DK69]KGO96487.1 hypothetical protein Q767_06170 [Flavobacterium enshiense DK69]